MGEVTGTGAVKLEARGKGIHCRCVLNSSIIVRCKRWCSDLIASGIRCGTVKAVGIKETVGGRCELDQRQVLGR